MWNLWDVGLQYHETVGLQYHGNVGFNMAYIHDYMNAIFVVPGAIQYSPLFHFKAKKPPSSNYPNF